MTRPFKKYSKYIIFKERKTLNMFYYKVGDLINNNDMSIKK